MKYYDIDKAQKFATQNKDFILGEHEAGRKHIADNFEINVKGRGKSRKEKLAFAETSRSLWPKDEEEEVIIVVPKLLKK